MKVQQIIPPNPGTGQRKKTKLLRSLGLVAYSLRYLLQIITDQRKLVCKNLYRYSIGHLHTTKDDVESAVMIFTGYDKARIHVCGGCAAQKYGSPSEIPISFLRWPGCIRGGMAATLY